MQSIKQRGFTIIEIMVVVVIIAILASIIAPKIMGRPDQARIVKAKEDIRSIESSLDLYRLDSGVYPTQAQGLQALVTQPTTAPVPTQWKPYLKHLPIDPWGRPYRYSNPGQHGEVDVYSLGTGGEENGSTVLGNWQND
jgi:general secretion pathway protein G